MRFAIVGEHCAVVEHQYHYYFATDDLPRLEPSGFGLENFNAKYNPERSATNQLVPFISGSEKLFFPDHRGADISDEQLLVKFPDEEDIDPANPQFHLRGLKQLYAIFATYDVHPLNASDLLLFHAYDGILWITVEPVPKMHAASFRKPGEKAPPVPARNTKSGKLPASFKGQFNAYVVGDLHFLLTASGRLYKCAAKGKFGLEITEVWSDPARPLIGVVDCPETKQAFAFGWGSKPKNTDRYWIEFGDKPVETVYALQGKLKNDREDAFREVNECVSALKAAKALKPVPKPVPKK